MNYNAFGCKGLLECSTVKVFENYSRQVVLFLTKTKTDFTALADEMGFILKIKNK